MTSQMILPALPDRLAVANTGDEPRILALDLATRFGWAFGIPGKPPMSGSGFFTHNLRQKPADLDTNYPRLFANAQRFAELIGEMYEPTHVAFEQPIPPNKMRGATNANTFTVLNGLPACITGALFRMGVREFVSPTSIACRAYFLGRKPGKKDQDKPAVFKKVRALDWIMLEERVHNDFDRSDALCVWAYAEMHYSPRKCHHIDDISIRAKHRGDRLL